MTKRSGLAIAAVALLSYAGTAWAQPASMTFFVTSAGSGKGGDLGGLAGADRICQMLAQAVGAGGKTWHAYLSTQPTSNAPAVNARDRIGKGPWRNEKGQVIAKNVAQLHDGNHIDQTDSSHREGRDRERPG